MIIYKATAPSGKIYIGQTVQTLAQRRAHHHHHTETHTPFGRALRKYGRQIDWQIIDTAETLAELNRKEKFWIAELNALAPCGYNLQTGGDNWRHSAASRRNMSIAKLGNKNGVGNKGARGKKASPAHRAALSIATARHWAENRESILANRRAKRAARATSPQ